MRLNRLGCSATLAAVAVLGAACRRDRVPLETQLSAAASSAFPPTTGIVAGSKLDQPAVKNPFEGNAHAENEGKQYYAWFNCDGCHGAIGGGSIGPPLRDSDWIYGSAPQNIHQSILQGRPEGMPAFVNKMPEDVAWKLVAYVQSLGREGQTGGTSPSD